MLSTIVNFQICYFFTSITRVSHVFFVTQLVYSDVLTCNKRVSTAFAYHYSPDIKSYSVMLHKRFRQAQVVKFSFMISVQIFEKKLCLLVSYIILVKRSQKKTSIGRLILGSVHTMRRIRNKGFGSLIQVVCTGLH